jgi:hypothetical protein
MLLQPISPDNSIVAAAGTISQGWVYGGKKQLDSP